jgi:tetratricopeptide (TPR) repeat protein
MKCSQLFAGFLFIVTCSTYAQVKSWEESLTLPTYLVEKPDVNPIFYVPDAYQGAKRVIYPYQLNDNITNIKSMKTYKALYLENEYLKVCVLPEIGGKLFYATDKTNGYELFYRQKVIKPANIGMLGAWISGGIEWCVFHHHRASTFLPVNYVLATNEDGSSTIWIGEIEPRQRMQWTIGITLYPGKSYIEVLVRMQNRTDQSNSFLYWANVATHANEQYQVFFPPSVEYATYHSKNSFCHWPVTHETYNGYEYYQDSIDASWWKNHPNPISFFAHDLKEDFMGGYDHGAEAGTIHIGDHNIIKGAKLWQFGPGPTGNFWDNHILSDSGGAYAELMVGAFSDNQPDYSWIEPYEVKQFKHYWYPSRAIGDYKNANLNGVVNLEVKNNQLFFGFNTTTAHKAASVNVYLKDSAIYAETIMISPDRPFTKTLKITGDETEENFRAELTDEDGRLLIAYQPRKKKYHAELPAPVEKPADPVEIETNDELYFTGMRLQQINNPAIDPMTYFLEALRRDPGDTRCNTAMGIEMFRLGKYDEAKKYLRTAVRRQTAEYTRPKDCEALYYLGLILKNEHNYVDATDTLYRASWGTAFSAPAYFELARISSIQGNFKKAIEQISKALKLNDSNTKLIGTAASLYRLAGNRNEAAVSVDRLLVIDPIDLQGLYENIRLHDTDDSSSIAAMFAQVMGDNPLNYLELAADYINLGLYEDALKIIQTATSSGNHQLDHYALFYYYLGDLYDKMGDVDLARMLFAKGSKESTDYVFPFQRETVEVLEKALEYFPDDAKACYYLGNYWYDRQPPKALQYWEDAVRNDPSMAIAYRNLGFGYYQYAGDPEKAIRCYETALQYKKDPRYFLELDRLYERTNTDPKKRMQQLTANHDIVVFRKDALLREISVLVLDRQYDLAIKYLDGFYFPVQEGNELIHEVHVDAHLLRGLHYLEQNRTSEAINDFKTALVWPDNQQVRPWADYSREAQVYYFLALAKLTAGDKKEAEELLQRVADRAGKGNWFSYYSAMALKIMNHDEEALDQFNSLIRQGKEEVSGGLGTDFFAKFGEGLTRNEILAEGYFLQGLGYLGKDDQLSATANFKKSLDYNAAFIWAAYYLDTCRNQSTSR